MAIEAKATFVNQVERALSDKLTVDSMTKVLTVLSDILSGYKMESNDSDYFQNDDLLDAYLSALSVGGRSSKTIERYKYIVGRMMDELKVPTRSVTVYHLRQYLSNERARGISDGTLESTRQVLSAYFNWLQRERLIDVNPCVNLGAIKCQKKKKDIYSDVDIERMRFGCKSTRDRAILYFLRATACRISEMTQLNRDDVDLSAMECKVLGKGNKERMVYLDSVAVMALKDYLNERTDDNPALFAGRGTERMTPHGVRKMLTQLGVDTNVYHVHPHKFRRTTATNLIKHGMPIQEVSAILGHDRLDTTMEYVVLNQTDIKHAYMRYAS